MYVYIYMCVCVCTYRYILKHTSFPEKKHLHGNFFCEFKSLIFLSDYRCKAIYMIGITPAFMYIYSFNSLRGIHTCNYI